MYSYMDICMAKMLSCHIFEDISISYKLVRIKVADVLRLKNTVKVENRKVIDWD